MAKQGEWKAGGNGVHDGITCIAIAEFNRRSENEAEFEKACEHAKLIAAAPELLEACRRALATIEALCDDLEGQELDGERIYNTNETLELLGDAIAKANGDG